MIQIFEIAAECYLSLFYFKIVVLGTGKRAFAHFKICGHIGHLPIWKFAGTGRFFHQCPMACPIFWGFLQARAFALFVNLRARVLQALDF